jgi:type 1 glutamine amidotransferase
MRTTSRRSLLSGTLGAAGVLAISCLRRAGGQTQRLSEAEQKQKIEAALPAKAFVTPRKPRRLLIFDLNVNYGGHASIPTANQAFTLMGAKTGAFETEISKNPAVFASESLKRFDAVFFNNTVGNLFEDPALRQSLVEFVYSGGGLMGVHGTSVAFMKWPGAIEDWPEFGIMLGARGANHKTNDEHVFIKVEDPTHPVVQPFGGDFDYRDEFFRVHEPYSRDRVRVLLSIDTAKTDMTQQPSYGKVIRADNDYALAWVRQYGRGRVFYCGFAHHPSVFWDPKQLQFYLAATQFALGDLDAPTTPSAKLTPAIRAQEKLGWRLGLVPWDALTPTLFETIDRAAELGLLYVGSRQGQKVSRAIRKDFGEQLSSDELRQIRLKLDAGGVRLLTHQVDHVPSYEADWRRMLEFARRMGVEALDVGLLPPSLLTTDFPQRLCDEYGIRLAQIRASSTAWPEEEIVRLDQSMPKGKDVSFLLDLVHKRGSKPVMFSVEFRLDESVVADRLTQIIEKEGAPPATYNVESRPKQSVSTRTIDLFNRTALRLANGGKS